MSGTETADGAQFMAESQSEQEFMRHVMAYAKARGWLVYHTHISKRSTEGFPDLCMVRGGRLVFAELKREPPRLKNGAPSVAATYEPTVAQWTWLDALGDVTPGFGGAVSAFLWRPSSWGQIEEVLK